jgi:hypothetical protein
MSRKNKVLISRNIKRVSVQSRHSFSFSFFKGGGGRQVRPRLDPRLVYVGNTLKAYQEIVYTSVIP